MYDYNNERPKIFTEEGQVGFLKARDRVKWLLKEAGSFMMQNAVDCSWESIAYIDRMVELGEIKEVTNGDVFGQHRVFVSAH